MISEKMKMEYDHFGAWIIEIDHDNAISPLFEPHFSLDKSVLFAIKIPRPMERRKLKADMDLYDYLIALYKDHILICRRENKSVETRKVSYSEILYVQHLQDLLLGELRLYLDNDEIVVPYNTVSADSMEKCISIIRQYFKKSTRKMNLETLNPLDIVDVILYRNLAKMIMEKENMKLISFQAGVPVDFPSMTFFEKMFKTKIAMQVQPSMVFTNEQELLLLERTIAIKPKYKGEYGHLFSYIPFGTVESMKDIGPSPYHNDETMRNFQISFAHKSISCFMANAQNTRALEE